MLLVNEPVLFINIMPATGLGLASLNIEQIGGPTAANAASKLLSPDDLQRIERTRSRSSRYALTIPRPFTICVQMKLCGAVRSALAQQASNGESNQNTLVEADQNQLRRKARAPQPPRLKNS